MTGVRYSSKDDFEALQKAAIMYDALYTYCKVKLLGEKYESELSKLSKRDRRQFLLEKLKEY